MRLDGYIRVSQVRRRRGESFISPAVQREQIEGWARFKGAEILQIHTDLDESGGRLERPGIAAIVARVEAGQTNGLVVAKLDRFARSLTGALETIRRLDEAGAILVSVAEGLDPTTPAGKMMMRVMLAMAEFELDRVRENWNESRRRAVARGAFPATSVPTGYLRRADGGMRPDPELAEHVAEGFRMRASYRTWGEIIEYFSEHAVRSPFGTTHWAPSSLAILFRNRAYLGEVASGAYINRAAHEPLIDRGTWELAQRTRTLATLRSEHPAALTGLLRCPGCRHPMKAGGRLAASGEFRHRYWCAGEDGASACEPRRSTPATLIEPFVEERFFELYERSPQRHRVRSKQIGAAEAALAAAEARLDAARTPGATRTASNLVETASQELVELARSRLLPSPAELRRRWRSLPATERRRHLALLIDTVFLRPDRGLGLADRVLVLPFGTGPTELPLQGRSRRCPPYPWPECA
jgi:site-specific DNA recombinase